MYYMYVIGITLIIVGSLGHFFNQPFFKFIFGVGALVIIISQLSFMFNVRNPDFRQKRFLRMNLILSLMLAVAAYSMFDGTTLWIVIVLIYALTTLFMSFRAD